MKISLPLLMLYLVSRQVSVMEAFLLSNSGGTSMTPSRHHQVRRKVGSMGQHSLNMIASTSSSRSYAKDNNNKNKGNNDEGHFLLKQYMTASGEIVNPYNVLQVPRNANRADIKGSYKQLAKRYHPDGARNRAILPGKCNNEEEVREEWEKIQIAYSILIDNKTRKRYDRSEIIADPGAAMRRAAVEATMIGVTSIGKGLFSLGLLAVETLSNSNNNNKGKDENDDQ